MIMQVGYEIDSEGNVGNETRRIEDLQLRFILLMAMINTTIEDSEAKMPIRIWESHFPCGMPSLPALTFLDVFHL